MGPLKPCLICGEPSPNSRCEEHRIKDKRKRPSATQRGYDYKWQKLSTKARQMQPWCTDCGATQKLTVDHSKAAWDKAQSGQTLTLKDFGTGLLFVRCVKCNKAAGDARGANVTRT